jgi:hypothetical protein
MRQRILFLVLVLVVAIAVAFPPERGTIGIHDPGRDGGRIGTHSPMRTDSRSR